MAFWKPPGLKQAQEMAERMESLQQDIEQRLNKLGDKAMASDLRAYAPIEFTVYRIDNGYILRYEGDMQTMSRGRMIYCANEKEMAEHLIASSTKKKLNIPEQLDMFTDIPIGRPMAVPSGTFTATADDAGATFTIQDIKFNKEITHE